MTQSEISSASPFFIVHDAAAALSFYRDQLGFDITYQEPADDPFFGIVCRGGAMIMLKSVGVDPLPNYKREPAARWDAYLYVPDRGRLRFIFRSSSVLRRAAMCANASSGRSRPTTRCRRRAKTHVPERRRSASSPDCSERINEEIPQTTSHLRSPVMRHCYSIIFLLEERNALSTTLLESQRSILCSEVFEPNAFKICVYHAGSRIRHD